MAIRTLCLCVLIAFFVMIDKLVQFAQEHHAAFKDMPAAIIHRMFEVYKDTTLVWEVAGEIKGFAIYQDWPDRLHFLVIAGSGTWQENLQAMLKGRHQLPDKMISYFDERTMELKKWQK